MHKIESFKTQIDSLIDVVKDAFAKSPELPDSAKKRLGVMILKMQDGVLEAKYVNRLGKWLCADRQALKYYVEFQNLSALLRMYYKDESRVQEAVGEKKD